MTGQPDIGAALAYMDQALKATMLAKSAQLVAGFAHVPGMVNEMDDTVWSLVEYVMSAAKVRLPVPHPASRISSPSAQPEKSRNGSARRALQRPIIRS